MRKYLVVAMLAMLAFNVQPAGAQEDGAVDAGEVDAQAQAEAAAAAKLAKEEKKRAAKQKKRTMESCLTLVRSFYGAQEQMVSDFTAEHPTVDKSRLLSKILAQMMINCNGAINDEQITALQKHKLSPLDFDYTQTGYEGLIAIDWDALRFAPANPDEPVEGEGSGPVEMTSQEILMSNEVEEYSDELKRELDEETRSSMGKTTLFFIDLENMSGASSLIYLAVVCAIFAAIFFFFYKELMDQEPDFNTVRREEIKIRRELKKQK